MNITTYEDTVPYTIYFIQLHNDRRCARCKKLISFMIYHEAPNKYHMNIVLWYSALVFHIGYHSLSCLHYFHLISVSCLVCLASTTPRAIFNLYCSSMLYLKCSIPWYQIQHNAFSRDSTRWTKIREFVTRNCGIVNQFI